MAQQLRLCTSTTGGTGSVPDHGISICCVVQLKKKNLKKKIKFANLNCNHILKL